MKRIVGRLALLTVVLISGCSVLEFAYNRADRFALREIERYLDLRPEQREATSAVLADLHAAHRREQLAPIAGDLRRFSDVLAEPLTVDDWEAWAQRLERLIAASLEPLPTRAAPLIAMLDDAQLEAFWSRLAEERETRRVKREDRAPRERAKAVERSLRRWIGRLSPAQRSAVRAWTESREPEQEDPAYRAYLAEREQALRALIVTRREPGFETRLVAFVAEDAVPPSSRQRWKAERMAFFGLLASLSADLSSAQRERAQRRLRDYATQIEGLAAAADRP